MKSTRYIEQCIMAIGWDTTLGRNARKELDDLKKPKNFKILKKVEEKLRKEFRSKVYEKIILPRLRKSNNNKENKK